MDFFSQLDDESESESEGEEKKPKIYQPPKLTAMHYGKVMFQYICVQMMPFDKSHNNHSEPNFHTIHGISP